MRPPLAAALLLAACTKPSAPPPAPVAPASSAPAPAPAALPQPLAPATRPEASPAKPAPLAPDEDRALDTYAAFSDDDLAFAVAEPSPGAGLTVVTFYAVPTSTIEKRMVLDSPDGRARVAEQLAADDFPRPGKPQKLPPGLAVTVTDGRAQVTVAGQPAAPPFNPFKGSKVARAAVVAASSDGKVAAIRTTATNGAGEFGPMTDVRFVKLFE